MAERWERDRDRGFGDRAADEVRSWFGADEAQRRRERDEWESRYEGRQFGKGSWTGEPVRSRDRERWSGPEGYRDRGRDYRYAGETALGRPDWGWGREGTYEERDRLYRANEARTRMPDMGPAYLQGEAAYALYPWRSPHGRRDYVTSRGYAGIGPKGYRRSEQRIMEDVCDRLTEDPRVDASDIEVTCAEGTVTLTGTVQSREEKRMAEDVAESVTGVRDVNNHLRVSSGALGSPGAPQTPPGLSSPGGEARQRANAEAERVRRR